ncbi:phospholipase A2 inhibitor and Ly6/PLAUR domain-containing protein-like [Notechis scutatus]|uniref:Phospholipase A2 inhibitor and Ly6/PLAUR domain-containing protein-like n=1 Tax=Notechis scutatus TaxID=8663 RepID=A0A6J1U1Z3_9SAUR|nr:phospholipase A2 inhibitor and Ly6/PLAUR domain-containing protein-like [Notechis scutatus]
MKPCLSFGLLSALIASGIALKCEVCIGQGHNCSGNIEVCPPEHDFCGITAFESVLEELQVQGIIKSCAPSSVCEGGSAHINLGKKGRSRTSVFCCKHDACNTDFPVKLPELDTKINGLRCPACYASFPDSCKDDTVDCVGSESQCINLAGYIHFEESSTKVAMKGCTTHDVCDATIGGAATFSQASSAITSLECMPASSTASRSPGPTGLFFLAMMGFLRLQLGS